MKTKAWFMLILFLFFTSTAGLAVRVTQLYRASIPVASQSKQERDYSVQSGLEQVLIKVSGNTNVIQNPAIKAHLNSAETLMQEFGYAQSANPAKPYLLQMDFDPDGVNKLLRDAGAPMWGQVRPLILVWLDFEIAKRPAEIIGADSANVIPANLKEFADARGIPVIFPVMDVTDMNAVSASDVANMTIPTLQAAGKRYASDAILIGRIMTVEGGFSSQWKLVLGDQQWDWSTQGKQIPELLSFAIDNVANTLASRYSGVVTNNVKKTITLKVEGVTESDDFSELMAYLKNLPSVSDVQPVHVTGDEVLLTISLRGDEKLLTQAFSIGQKLTPKIDPTVTDPSVLVYQWNH